MVELRGGFSSSVIFACLLAAVAPTSARASAEDVLVFPAMSKGDADWMVVRAVNDALAKVAAEVMVASVFAGDDLQIKLGEVPITALTACNDDLACISKLGQRVGAKELVFGQARAQGGGVELTFIAITAQEGALLRKVRMEVPSAAEADKVIAGNFYALLGMDKPGTIEIAAIEATEAVEIDGKVVGHGPGWYEVAPGRHEVKSGSWSTTVTVHPGVTATVVQPRPETEEPALAIASSASPTWSAYRWGGLGMFVGAATAVVIGAAYRSEWTDTKYLLTQPAYQADAPYYERRADYYHRISNISYTFAALMVGAGVVLLAYDWRFVVTPGVSGDSGGVQAVLAGSF